MVQRARVAAGAVQYQSAPGTSCRCTPLAVAKLTSKQCNVNQPMHNHIPEWNSSWSRHSQFQSRCVQVSRNQLRGPPPAVGGQLPQQYEQTEWYIKPYWYPPPACPKYSGSTRSVAIVYCFCSVPVSTTRWLAALLLTACLPSPSSSRSWRHWLLLVSAVMIKLIITHGIAPRTVKGLGNCEYSVHAQQFTG